MEPDPWSLTTGLMYDDGLDFREQLALIWIKSGRFHALGTSAFVFEFIPLSGHALKASNACGAAKLYLDVFGVKGHQVDHVCWVRPRSRSIVRSAWLWHCLPVKAIRACERLQ